MNFVLQRFKVYFTSRPVLAVPLHTIEAFGGIGGMAVTYS
jgi:hypothetical protein